MLDQTQLRTSLRAFCDPDFGSFAGFPTTRDLARHKWADAFSDYFDAVEEDLTPPPGSHASMSHTGVNGAFFGDLSLDDTTSAADAAADFAGAWRQGVLAVTPGTPPGASDATSTYVFVSFTNLTSLHNALLATLTSLFNAPSRDGLARLTDIAQALHTATSGLLLSTTATNTSSGATSTVPLGVL